MVEAPILSLRGVSKYFGGVHALEDVDFDVYPQEIVALVGDNGAGKSTLVKIIAGVHRPTKGQIFFFGQPVEIHSPRDAQSLGIEIVYQELALIETRDVPANFFLGREPVKGRLGIFVDRKKMVEDTVRTLEELGIELPHLRTPVRYLSGGQRQALAIGRVMPWGGKIIIMDEPTAALGVKESRRVLDLILRLKEKGCSVIVISHNMRHVFNVADRIVVLRGGRKVGDKKKSETTPDEIVKLIVGADML
ncbi:MAG: sugar ABC transporter ATP-binding protein [Candidatus Caldatribacterium sp.]|nr:sugar ABC transporter ATP-binding protein [Candidatus Caldatribacterium sp.]